jgi:hypothetical protein
MNYTWPETTFAQTNTMEQQLDHILSEVDEVTELGPFSQPMASDNNLADLVEELMDLHHSIETFMRIVERERSAVWLNGAAACVKAKNFTRGYYD